MKQPYRFSESTRTEKEQSYGQQMEAFFNSSDYSGYEKMANFPLFSSRQDITKYLAKLEIFKLAMDVHGSVIECGCLFGGGLMWWAHLSSIFEPVNTTRKIIGFDTFEGIPSMAVADKDSKSEEAKTGGLRVDSQSTILKAARLHDANRPIGHLEKVEIVKGDACKTIPKYVCDNKHLMVSLLVLDFDIYEPSAEALKCFVPLMPKGAVILFDELNNANWPGETQALMDVCGVRKLEIRRFPWASTISYAII